MLSFSWKRALARRVADQVDLAAVNRLHADSNLRLIDEGLQLLGQRVGEFLGRHANHVDIVQQRHGDHAVGADT